MSGAGPAAMITKSSGEIAMSDLCKIRYSTSWPTDTEIMIHQTREIKRLRAENAEQKAEIEHLKSDVRDFQADSTRLHSQIAIMQKTIDGFTGGDVWLLMSMCNYLADQLSQYTGRTVPDELSEATRECWSE